MSLLNKNHNPKEQPYPLLDVSPYFPSAPNDATTAKAENDFMSISLKKYTEGNRNYPLRAINSECSNLMYLGYTTLTTYDACMINDNSTIQIDWKLTKMRPVAFCFRPSTSIERFPDSIRIFGYSTIGNIKKVSKIAQISAITQGIYESGIFYINETQSKFFDGLKIQYGTGSDYDSASIGTLKILAYPQDWNNEIQNSYNQHILSLFDYAAATTNPEKGQVNYT